MAGAFIKSKYAASYGGGTNVHPIRVQPETLDATIQGHDNAPPSGAVINNTISAVISRGTRAKGLRPRTVTLELTSTPPPPAGYKPGSITTIPCLNTVFYDTCANATDDESVTYLGATWRVSYVTAEKVR